MLRGKWVLEELLGTPPPPPPPMVKALPADDRVQDGMTFRQRLEQHRKDANCASCHARLDPLGFGLENFDASAAGATEIGGRAGRRLGQADDRRGRSPAPAELKTILAESKRELFVRNLVERMLSYALRRGVEYYDTPTVKEIMAELEANDHRGTALIVAVAKSFPFQYRRNEPSRGHSDEPARTGRSRGGRCSAARA